MGAALLINVVVHVVKGECHGSVGRGKGATGCGGGMASPANQWGGCGGGGVRAIATTASQNSGRK